MEGQPKPVADTGFKVWGGGSGYKKKCNIIFLAK